MYVKLTLSALLIVFSFHFASFLNVLPGLNGFYFGHFIRSPADVIKGTEERTVYLWPRCRRC